MRKHTPGPWQACTHRVFDRDVIGVNAAADKSKVIAVTGEQRAADEDESIANAYLIAAAPELLELANEFKAFATSGASFSYPLGSVQKLHELIAKIEGASNAD